MRWKIVEYSKSQIVNAGSKIKSISPSDKSTEFKEMLPIIDNWRASHAYPLHVIYCHLRRIAKTTEKDIVVVQRLKRLTSIVAKLQREPNMNLWTMQDLGGCRIIVPTINDVYDIIKEYKTSRVRHILKKEYDYISSPKHSGYRSYHLVYQYQSDKKDSHYNKNMLIEIQVRTKLQHLWATALETMGLFTRQALKSSQGDDSVLRFFALVSSVFTNEEKMPKVPYTSDILSENIDEIRSIDKSHNLINMLKGISTATYHVGAKKSEKLKNGYYLLTLDHEKYRVSMKYFKIGQINEATDAYRQIESTRAENKIDAVLVSTDSFNTLKAAYPNYFTDIRDFVSILEASINTTDLSN